MSALLKLTVALLAVAPVAATAQRSAEIARPYLINPGDEIEIYVWGEERLQRVIRVLPDGTVSFPLVGRIVVSGRQTTDIEKLVTAGLQSQYRGQVPQVTVSVRAPSGLQFSVAGKVKSSGTFTPGRSVNVIEALALAGGPDEFANLDNILILRKTETGVRSIRTRLTQVFKGNAGAAEAAGAVPVMETGDTIIVP